LTINFNADIGADVILPGKATISFCIRNESDLVFTACRDAITSRIKKMKSNFKNCFFIYTVTKIESISFLEDIEKEVIVHSILCKVGDKGFNLVYHESEICINSIKCTFPVCLR